MIRLLIKLLYGGFDCRGLNKKNILVMAFFQKMLRVNANVPWPVHWASRVDAPEKIQRGTRVPGYMPGCYFDGRNGIIIGENVLFGPNVNVISMNHDLCDFNDYSTAKPIVIGKNSWIGAGCTILPGVELGEHTIVGAGSVVTKSFVEPDQVIAGNPACVVKKISSYREL